MKRDECSRHAHTSTDSVADHMPHTMLTAIDRSSSTHLMTASKLLNIEKRSKLTLLLLSVSLFASQCQKYTLDSMRRARLAGQAQAGSVIVA